MQYMYYIVLDTLLTQNKKEILLFRIGVPDDCAGIVSFLASDQARYITGENIVVAGGTQSRL